jgi:hypothetical protein
MTERLTELYQMSKTMKLFEPFAWRDHAQPSRDGHLAGPAGFAFAAASAEPAGLAGLARLNADVQACADRDAWIIWSYNALFEDEFYPNYRMAKHKFAALV